MNLPQISLANGIIEKGATFYLTLFLLSATLQGVVLVFLLPPFQGADELNHSYRALAISSGRLLSEMTPAKQPGGWVDANVGKASDQLRYLAFAPSKKVTVEAQNAMQSIGWSEAATLEPYPNTAVNSPIFYLPAAIGMGTAKGLGLGIAPSMEAGRFFNLLAYLTIGGAAVALAGRAAPAFLVVLTLPMSISVGSYVTQDGLILATTALALAFLIFGARRPDNNHEPLFIASVLMLSLCGIAKAPYALLIIPLFFFPSVQLTRRIAIVSFAILNVLSWHLYVSIFLPVIWPTEPATQFALLVDHPMRILSIAIETLSKFGSGYIHQAVGVLGWLDTPLPQWFVVCAVFVYAYTLLLCCVNHQTTTRSSPLSFVLIFALASVASIAAIFLAMYVIWTPLGASTVDGVQGRYFLPLLLGAPFCLAMSAVQMMGEMAALAQRIGTYALVFYSGVTVAITIATVSERYFP